MTVVKLHYGGWVELPEEMRDELAMRTGETFTVQLKDGAIVLTPQGGAPVADEPPPAPATAPRARKAAAPAPATEEAEADAEPAPARTRRKAVTGTFAVAGTKVRGRAKPADDKDQGG